MAAASASHPAAVSSLDEVEGRAIIVLVFGELGTYLCRAGEPRPFLEEKAIPEDVLGCTTSTTSSSSTAKTASKQEAASRLISKLREQVLDRNIIMVFPIYSSQEYREKLLLFVFEKLQVRTVIAMSDLVADSFALGLRDSLVLHASLSKLSIGRVEAGVTVKYTTSTSGSLFQIVKPTACNGNCDQNVDDKEMKTEGMKNTENGDTGSLINNTTADTNSNCTVGVGGDGALSLRSFSLSKTVDLLDEKYREKLLSFFGDVVYQSVVSLQEKQQGQHNGIRMKRGRTEEKYGDNEEEEENKVFGKDNNGNTVLATSSRNKRRGALGRLISSVTDGDSLPVIITGEALNIAPLLRDFLEESIRICSKAHKEDSDSSSSSSSEDSDSTIGSSSSNSSSSSTSTNNNNNNNNNNKDDNNNSDSSSSSSSSSSSAYACGLLKLQPLPLPGFSWMLSVIGASLVAQLSLAELSKLRISRGDAISSKGSIIHWRSVV